MSGLNSVAVLIGYCEYNTLVCSSDYQLELQATDSKAPQSFTLDNVGSPPVTLKMKNFKAKEDQCSWVFKVECGAPGIKIDTDNTNVEDTDVQISFIEYSAQFVYYDKLVLDDNMWLNKKEIPKVYDM